MRSWIIGAAAAAFLTTSALAQSTEIEGVIGSQIEAFKADDFVSAFEFAAPSIRGIFRTPENFGRMVTQGYPMVWRPAEVTYLDLRQQGPGYIQTVRIKDADGAVHYLAYAMIETSAGWKINGVQVLQAPGVSA